MQNVYLLPIECGLHYRIMFIYLGLLQTQQWTDPKYDSLSEPIFVSEMIFKGHTGRNRNASI